MVPMRRLPGIELVDALTRVAHRVSPEELLTGRARGDYQGFCGVRFLAAGLTDPGRDRCPDCVVSDPMIESSELVAAKRLLDEAKELGFTLELLAPLEAKPGKGEVLAAFLKRVAS